MLPSWRLRASAIPRRIEPSLCRCTMCPSAPRGRLRHCTVSDSAGVINQPILPVVLLLICRPTMLTHGVNIKGPRERCGGVHPSPRYPRISPFPRPDHAGVGSTIHHHCRLHVDASFPSLESGLGQVQYFVFVSLLSCQVDLFSSSACAPGGPPGGPAASCSLRSKIDALKRVPGVRTQVLCQGSRWDRHACSDVEFLHDGSQLSNVSIFQNYL